MDWRTLTCIVVLANTHGILHAQSQVAVAAPFQSSSNSFVSNSATRLGVRQVWPHGVLFFRSGGFGPGPAFGGSDPASQSFLGFAGRKGNAAWNLGFSFGQGSSRSAVSVTPSLTMPGGGFGFLNNSIQRPFVMGFVPVVGGRPLSPLESRLARLQFQQAVSDAKSKRRQAEAEELREARPASSLLGSRYPKVDDPPLILGPRP